MFPSENRRFTSFGALAGIVITVLVVGVAIRVGPGQHGFTNWGDFLKLNDAGNLLNTDGYKKAIDAVSEKVGKNSQLLQLALSEDSVVFYFRKESDDSAFGYTYVASNSKLVPVTVGVDGTGSLKDEVVDFSMATELDPDEMIEKVKQKAGDEIDVEAITLVPRAMDGSLSWAWAVSYEAKGRTGLSATVNLDGKVTDFDRV